jgi:hypothetical protein
MGDHWRVTARRRAAEHAHEQANHESLLFMAWVREAPTSELLGQVGYAKDWQYVAIRRELARRGVT